MARIGIVFGWLLCGLTFYGLVASEEKYPTQFVPMMLGIPTLFCGVVALNPHRRKMSMHVAAGIALFGVLLGGVWIVVDLVAMGRGEEVHLPGLQLVAGLTLLCSLFFAIRVMSFKEEQRRKSARPEPPPATIHLHDPTDGDRDEAFRKKSRESA